MVFAFVASRGRYVSQPLISGVNGGSQALTVSDLL
jgi:hypothetical protein